LKQEIAEGALCQWHMGLAGRSLGKNAKGKLAHSL